MAYILFILGFHELVSLFLAVNLFSLIAQESIIWNKLERSVSAILRGESEPSRRGQPTLMR